MRTIKDSCLARMVLIGEGSRRRAGREFVAHDHHERNHQGLDNRLTLPLSTAPPPPWSRPGPPAARWDVARRLSVSSVIHDRPSTPRSSFWTVRRWRRWWRHSSGLACAKTGGGCRRRTAPTCGRSRSPTCPSRRGSPSASVIRTSARRTRPAPRRRTSSPTTCCSWTSCRTPGSGTARGLAFTVGADGIVTP